MIHSRSYTYVIKNVYSDPAEVFDTILDDDRILSRASSVTESYNDFIHSAQEYGNGSLWEFANDGVDLGISERYNLKRKLYRAIANVNILEGIRFYVSFACSFAFGELKLWRDPLKLSLSSPETKTSILSLLKTSSTNGVKEMTQRWQRSLRKKNQS